jgi:hypothetical protein
MVFKLDLLSLNEYLTLVLRWHYQLKLQPPVFAKLHE